MGITSLILVVISMFSFSAYNYIHEFFFTFIGFIILIGGFVLAIINRSKVSNYLKTNRNIPPKMKTGRILSTVAFIIALVFIIVFAVVFFIALAGIASYNSAF